MLGNLEVTFSPPGPLTGIHDPDAALTFTYDSGGRMTAAGTSGPGTGQPAVTLTYGYDQAGNRASLTDDLSSVGRPTYAYDAATRLATITRSVGATQGPRVVFGYDDAHRRTAITRTVNGADPRVATTISHDDADRVTTITHRSVSGGTTTMLATFAYGYDSGGRLTGVDRPGTASDESFGYDLNGKTKSRSSPARSPAGVAVAHSHRAARPKASRASTTTNGPGRGAGTL
ncbi:MAG: hypothetical protein KatS3mg108_2574 [Isosphaeraceae bacterium]|jgi:YD repeat-containing protein|nr:MAG: hypothetical protein KatS3mg108_2574 [Isosphaeraceae bacterium]